MPYVTVVDDSPAGTVERLDTLMTDILAEPDGLAARYAGVVDGKLCIVAVWDSQEQAEDFMRNRLPAGLEKLLGPDFPRPRGWGLDVEHCYVR